MSLSPDVRQRLQRIAAEWREAAGYGRPIELSAHEAREVAAALTATLSELDVLRAQLAALTPAERVIVLTEVDVAPN